MTWPENCLFHTASTRIFFDVWNPILSEHSDVPLIKWKYTFVMGSHLFDEILELMFVIRVFKRKIGQNLKDIWMGRNFRVLFVNLFSVFVPKMIDLFLAFYESKMIQKITCIWEEQLLSLGTLAQSQWELLLDCSIFCSHPQGSTSGFTSNHIWPNPTMWIKSISGFMKDGFVSMSYWWWDWSFWQVWMKNCTVGLLLWFNAPITCLMTY